MKLNFQNLNIEPQPNPKPLRVQRVAVSIVSAEGKTASSSDGFITNACVHPDAFVRPRVVNFVPETVVNTFRHRM
jgi:hypothetical protein